MNPFMNLLVLSFGLAAPAAVAGAVAHTGSSSPALGHGDGVEITLAPSAGLVVSKSFELGLDLEYDDMHVFADGERTELPPGYNHTDTRDFHLGVTDRYTATDEDGPTRIERSHDTFRDDSTRITTDDKYGTRQRDTELASGLEDVAVVFARGDDGWDCELASERGAFDEDLALSLDWDLDLTALLPDGPVHSGETWELEPESFLFVLEPGGMLKTHPVGEDPADSWKLQADWHDERELEVGGDLSATLAEVALVDGAPFAVIELEVEIDATEDLTAQERRESARWRGPNGETAPPSEGHTLLQHTYQGDGTLLWDLGRGIPASMELELDVERCLHRYSFLYQSDLELENMYEDVGTLTVSASYEVQE